MLLADRVDVREGRPRQRELLRILQWEHRQGIGNCSVRAVGELLVLLLERCGEVAGRERRRVAQEGLRLLARCRRLRISGLGAEEERVRAGGRPADRERLSQRLIGLLALLGPEPELEQRVEHAAEVDRHSRHVVEPELAQAKMGQLVLLAALDESKFLLETHAYLLVLDHTLLDGTLMPRAALRARMTPGRRAIHTGAGRAGGGDTVTPAPRWRWRPAARRPLRAAARVSATPAGPAAPRSPRSRQGA